jgi:hypothetical protein
MTKDQFHNGLRLIHSIDSHEVGDGSEPPKWYMRFNRDPVGFFIRCDDDTAAIIWAAMEKRMPTRASGPTVEQIAWVLCCGKADHCRAAEYADGISAGSYAARNCEGAEIQKQAAAVMRLLNGEHP